MLLHRIDPQPSPRVRDASQQFEVVAQVVQANVDLYKRKGLAPPWIGYLAEEEGRIVGTCGFAGPPVEGEAEVAYFTFPGHEGRGVAGRMAAALMRETRKVASTEVFIAHTLPAEGASTAVLKKLGFVCLGVVEHPEDGPVWKWRQPHAGPAPVVIPSSVEAIWRAFCATTGQDRSADFYEPFHFHNNERGAAELAHLVLAGTKRATASLVWTYEHDGKRPPWPGSLSVMTDWHGKPLGIIETRRIEPVPFEDVTAEFAAMEGEGDGSLGSWREGHWAYFTDECARIGRTPDRRMLVLCEQFELVYANGETAA